MKSFASFLLTVSILLAANSAVAQDGGEILATVNGETITRADLDRVMTAATGVELSGDYEVGVLRQIVNNTLLSQAFQENSGLDDAELEALSQIQRLNGFAQLQIKKITESIARTVVSSDPRVQTIIADNPAAFTDRKLLIFLETNEFSAPEDFWSSLPAANTFEDVMAIADEKDIQFSQQIISVHSDTIQPRFRDVLLAATINDVLVFRQSNADRGRLFVVKHVYDAPLTRAAAETVARNILVQALQRQAVDDFLKEKTASSVITYSESIVEQSSLPVGTTEEAIAAREAEVYYYLAGLFGLGFWGAITHTMIARCWNGRFYVPMSGLFSDEARSIRAKLKASTVSFDTIERTLPGASKVLVFLVSCLGYIAYAVLVSTIIRDRPAVTSAVVVCAIISGFTISYLCMNQTVLRATDRYRVAIMSASILIYFLGVVFFLILKY